MRHAEAIAPHPASAVRKRASAPPYGRLALADILREDNDDAVGRAASCRRRTARCSHAWDLSARLNGSPSRRSTAPATQRR
jgi:hypothetical protein